MCVTPLLHEDRALDLFPVDKSYQIPVCVYSLVVLRLHRGRHQEGHGRGHLSSQLPVLPGPDPGLCGDGTSDLAGGWGSGCDVLFEPHVFCGLPVLLAVCGVPAATSGG